MEIGQNAIPWARCPIKEHHKEDSVDRWNEPEETIGGLWILMIFEFRG